MILLTGSGKTSPSKLVSISLPPSGKIFGAKTDDNFDWFRWKIPFLFDYELALFSDLQFMIIGFTPFSESDV